MVGVGVSITLGAFSGGILGIGLFGPAFGLDCGGIVRGGILARGSNGGMLMGL